jgi:hypothetical protein
MQPTGTVNTSPVALMRRVAGVPDFGSLLAGMGPDGQPADLKQPVPVAQAQAQAQAKTASTTSNKKREVTEPTVATNIAATPGATPLNVVLALGDIPSASANIPTDVSAAPVSAAATTAPQALLPIAQAPAPSPLSKADPAAPLSFTAKIQTKSDSASPQRMVLGDSVNSVASAWKKGQRDSEADSKSDISQPELPVTPIAKPAVNDLSALISNVQPSVATSSATASPQRPALDIRVLDAPVAVQPQAAPTQLKDVSFRIPQADGSSVQLRLTTQAGELKVAVHAASPDLNQGLRDSLSDLTKKLSDSGFHAETWRPGVAATAAPMESDATRNQNQSGSDTNTGDQQSQSRQQSRDDQDDNQSRKPKWAEEFDNSTFQFQTSRST